MLFLYIITALTVNLALFSLISSFPYLVLLSIVILPGLALSWWQQKNNKKIPHLKTLINILLVILAINALLPFFTQSSDILAGLIRTWACFLALSTFTVYSKRDYYIIQVLSLGLIIFSCFSETEKAIIPLVYILGFFIIWIIALRGMSLLEDIKGIKDSIQKKGWFSRELIIGAGFIGAVIFFTLPLYLLLPRFNLPIPFLSRIVEQKYGVSYIDFPRNKLVSFLSSSEEKLSEPEGKVKGTKIGRKSLEGRFELEKKRKPVFFHSPQEYENRLEELKTQLERVTQEIERINQQLSEISEKENMPKLRESIEESKRLKIRRQELMTNKTKLESQRAILEEDYFKNVNEKTIVSLNEPGNKALLENLEQEIKTIEEKIQDKIRYLQTIKEELGQTESGIDQVRESVYHQAVETSVGKEVLRLWARKELSEELQEMLEAEISALKEEYEQYNKFIQEEGIKPEIFHSPQEYENRLEELKTQLERVTQEIERINQQLSEISEK
ncbi:MAG: transglutaminaseTgpA domain-containing protein, partial [Candidatus Omnitrophota bacterium]